MADDIYFSNEGDGLVEQWMNDIGTSIQKDPAVTKQKLESQAKDQQKGKAKTGLGKKAAPVSDDKLQSRLQQAMKRKKGDVKRGGKDKQRDDNDDDNDDDDDDVHGVIEREITRGSKGQTGASSIDHKAKKQKLGAASTDGRTDGRTDGQTSASSSGDKSLPLPQATNAIDSQHSEAPAQVVPQQQPDANGSSEGKSAFIGERKKRGKTRSKQKNIRRDNRSDMQKPQHLQISQIGKKDYNGRPLTKETKIALGVAQKSAQSRSDPQSKRPNDAQSAENSHALEPRKKKRGGFNKGKSDNNNAQMS
jgi:hypothetical protein